MSYVPDPTDELFPKTEITQAATAAWEFRALKAHIKFNVMPLAQGAVQNDSPAFVGIPTAPTAAPGTNTDQVATCAFVVAAGLSFTLPAAAGNAGLSLSSDGVSAGYMYSTPDAIAVLNFLGY